SQEFYGECRFNCVSNQDCPLGTICAGEGLCLEPDDLCLVTNCPEGTTCYQGICYPDEDPCLENVCPEGFYCWEGECIVGSPIIEISGTIYDAETNSPISTVGVASTHGDQLSDVNGNYAITTMISDQLTFTDNLYVSYTTPIITESSNSYDIYLNKNYCKFFDCGPGQECINGRCTAVNYQLSGEVRDSDTDLPLDNVRIQSLSFDDVLTGSDGKFSIEVLSGLNATFERSGYLIKSITVNENEDLIVYLNPDPCDELDCPDGFVCQDGECVPDPCAGTVCGPDEFCFAGSCFPLEGSSIRVHGTVRDLSTNDPIPAAITSSLGTSLADLNGFFVVDVPYGETLSFGAENYGSFTTETLKENGQELEIFLTQENCKDINCPDGSFCENGVCIPYPCGIELLPLQISPEIGTSETEYTFTITYTDPENSNLAIGYPRLELDANNNGSAEDSGDLTFAMSELDPSDIDLKDGKIYQVRVSGLKDNTAWKARVVAKNEFYCQVSTDFIDQPNVSVSNLDVGIFANNISFTNDTPDNNETITIFARVRNISDFPAENFVVSAYDGETQIFSTVIENLEARSNIDLSWDYSFEEAGFYQIKVVLDETDVLEEINELNNFAIRPVLVGNYVLPGGIQAKATPNSSTVYVGEWINISGNASYFGIDEGVNPDVAGANVSFSYENGSFQTTTSSNGTFSRSVKMPTTPGVYTFTGSVTDYTLTGEIPSFQIEVIPYPAKADLRANITLDQTEVLAGEEITGTATVTNLGELTATNFTFRYETCEGILEEVGINSLAPGETLSFDFAVSITSEIGSCFNKNNCSFTAIADVFNQVDDKTRSNNSVGQSVTVYPTVPDLTPSSSLIGFSSRMEDPFEFTVKVDNIGGVITSEAFAVNVYVDDELVDSRSFEKLDQCAQISYPVSVVFQTQEDHVIRIKVDEPLGSGSIVEYNEDNNEFVRTVKYSPPPVLRPNLYITNTYLSVEPGLPAAGETFLVKTKVRNTGQVSIEEAFEVNFQISEKGVSRNEIVQVPTGLKSGAEVTVEYETSLASDGSNAVLVELDPLNLIDESSEFDNKASMPLCLDFEVGQAGSVWNGGFIVYTEQNLTGRVRNLGLFTAKEVRVDFLLNGSEIGSTIIPELKPSYGGLGQFVSFPYTFREVGTFQLEMVIDRNDDFAECNEANNSITRSITVRAPQPDLRILSEYISPSNLNPDLDEEINLFVSFENIGSKTQSPFKIRVTVDDIQLGQDILVDALDAGQLATIPVETTYSSPTAGVKVVRSFVDIDQETDDLNYVNNDASRALVVGEAPNLFFTQIGFSTNCPQVGELIQINVDIENEGDLASNAELHFSYVTETDTIPIEAVPIFVDIQGSASKSITWTVINPEYSILAEIKNSDPQEFDDLDNFILGEFKDIVPPTLNTQDIAVYLDENGLVTISPEQVDNGSFDDCGIAELTLSQESFSCSEIGDQVILFTALDVNGNESSAEVTVTVLDDIFPEIIGIPENIIVETSSGSCGGIVEWAAPVSADNCVGHSIEQISGPVSGSEFPIGTSVVSYRANDASGNKVELSFEVTVEDKEAPSLIIPEAITVNTDMG
ncbi:CARDB domain-containing protein, partial [Algoriphagus sp.]|uniref:CARDB domain-containing protein n=1 Tax=Algoriphagus sp. TaxID=1872435 RepID=UPI00261E2254